MKNWPIKFIVATIICAGLAVSSLAWGDDTGVSHAEVFSLVSVAVAQAQSDQGATSPKLMDSRQQNIGPVTSAEFYPTKAEYLYQEAVKHLGDTSGQRSWVSRFSRVVETATRLVVLPDQATLQKMNPGCTPEVYYKDYGNRCGLSSSVAGSSM